MAALKPNTVKHRNYCHHLTRGSASLAPQVSQLWSDPSQLQPSHSCASSAVSPHDSSNEPALCHSAEITTLRELGLEAHTASETSTADSMVARTISEYPPSILCELSASPLYKEVGTPPTLIVSSQVPFFMQRRPFEA
jgi:hypothetical protein